MAGLSSWSPAVRKRSAEALGRREGDFVPALIKMLDGTDRDARYGACEALARLGPKSDPAAPKLRALLKDPDPWLQSLASQTLAELGPEARKASVSDLLAMTVRANPADPRRMAQRAACTALFSPYPGSRTPRSSILAASLEGVDRELLYPAVRSVLENDDGAARGSLQRIYGKLTDRDLVALLPEIVKAIRDLAPSNEMFGDDIRLAGLDLVSRLHLREGMPLCLSVVELKRWGAEDAWRKAWSASPAMVSTPKPSCPSCGKCAGHSKTTTRTASCWTRPSPGSKPPRIHPRWWTSKISRPVPERETEIVTRLPSNQSTMNKPAFLALTLPKVKKDDLEDLGPGQRQPNPTVVKIMEDEQTWRKGVQAYLANVNFADECVGMLLDALDASPYKDNTIIILWSDHGWHLGEKFPWSKFTLWEESARCVLICAAPGVTAGTRCDQPVSLIDMYPTLLEMCNLPAKAGLAGESFSPSSRIPHANAPSRPSPRTERVLPADGALALYRVLRWFRGAIRSR